MLTTNPHRLHSLLWSCRLGSCRNTGILPLCYGTPCEPGIRFSCTHWCLESATIIPQVLCIVSYPQLKVKLKLLNDFQPLITGGSCGRWLTDAAMPRQLVSRVADTAVWTQSIETLVLTWGESRLLALIHIWNTQLTHQANNLQCTSSTQYITYRMVRNNVSWLWLEQQLQRDELLSFHME